MKKIFFISLGVLLLTGLFAFRKAQNNFNNILSQLGLDKEEANSYIIGNILDGGVAYPRTKIMAQLALNKRVEAVKELGIYIKTHVQSPEFAKEYAQNRLEQKPEKPTGLYDNEENREVYQQDMKRWEKDYPASVNMMLKKRLSEFLKLTSGINYDAKLEKRGKKMIFSDPSFEDKDDFWKVCYRSGKPTVDAARQFAQQWLTELK
jgi:hypothetical protein